MPHFDIIKTNHPKQTFRVSKIMSDFDVKLEHSNEKSLVILHSRMNGKLVLLSGEAAQGRQLLRRNCSGNRFITAGHIIMIP
jgi:hypothetical protein